MATRRTKRSKTTKKKPARRSTKNPAKKRAKKTAKKSAKKSAKKTDPDATAVGTKAPRLRRPSNASATKKASKTPSKTPSKKTPSKKTPSKKTPSKKTPSKKTPSKKTKKSTKRARSSAKTVPGGSAPPMDDVAIARRALRDLREVLSRVSDADAELILGDGALERLLGAIVPPVDDGKPHVHLAEHKRRASLLARLRHGVNERSVHRVDDAFISPTRVQWFYDGLTFLEGPAPYEGVVGLFRDGVVRYALNVADASRDDALGPLESDFVSLTEARRAFRGSGSAEGLASLEELTAADDPEAWITWLVAHPWALGAQHASIERVVHRDEALPKVTAKRSTDGAQDALLVESPHTAIVGKTGRVLSSFRDVWLRAERQRMFVQRQTGYLKRELGWKVRDPRFIVLAGRGLSKKEREVVRDELERHHASIRLITFDELAALARRTIAFFEPRL